jgi:hypothetical protein
LRHEPEAGGLKVPALQLLQTDAPPELKVPALQLLQADAPPELKVPAEQLLHEVLPVPAV